MSFKSFDLPLFVGLFVTYAFPGAGTVCNERPRCMHLIGTDHIRIVNLTSKSTPNLPLLLTGRF